jgi:cyclic di-GMP phosphodiesterase
MLQPNHVLVVDDEELNRQLLTRVLERLGYTVTSAFDGIDALKKVEQNPPDLILLDINMPRMNGLEVAAKLKAMESSQMIPIVIISSFDDVKHRVQALEAGVDDFLAKPFDKTELRARVQSLMKVKAYNDHMLNYQKTLEQEVNQRTQQLQEAFEELKSASEKIKLASLDTVFRLSQAAEYKDEETGAHIRRMGYYTAAIARKLGLPQSEVDTILYAAPMHDIGKIGIPDRILLKPGSLDDTEWDIMKQHTVIGGRLLDGSDSEVIQVAQQIAVSHHEKWDGSGYPNGLEKGSIPLTGRIAAVADVFDALTTKRPYKDAYPIEKSFGIIEEGRKNHFDPAVLDAFFAIRQEITAIREECKDASDADR